MKADIDEQFKLLVHKYVVDPTHEMRVAFQKMPPAHKWLLFTIFEAGDRPSFLSRTSDVKVVEDRYYVLCPLEDTVPFAKVLEEASEGFVQIVRFRGEIVGITWIHPSCQDLAIEELAGQSSFRARFLRLCSAEGVEKALAVAAGKAGEKTCPLMVTRADWSELAGRCKALVLQDERTLGVLMNCREALSQTLVPRQEYYVKCVTGLLEAVWPAYLSKLNESPFKSWSKLREFFRVREIVAGDAFPPRLNEYWLNTTARVLDSLETGDELGDSEYSLGNFAHSIELIAAYEPSFLRRKKVGSRYRRILRTIVKKISNEVEDGISHDVPTDKDDNKARAKSLRNVAGLLTRLTSMAGINAQQEAILESGSEVYMEEAEFVEDSFEEEEDPYDDGGQIMESAADIELRGVSLDKLFEDL